MNTTNPDEASTGNDRSNFKDRYSRDGQRLEKDGEKVRDSRPGNAQNRRSVKDDSDLWSSVRQQRNLGQEDNERTYRKNADREHDREGAREPRNHRGFENHKRDGDRDVEGDHSTRRTGPGRGRNEPSWYRDDARKEGNGSENFDTTNAREWRDRETKLNRGSERDWNKGAKPELDPEWMDEPEPEAKKEAHTQEDFERWKEKMKTGYGPTQDTPLSTAEQRPIHERHISGAGIGTTKGKVDTPLVVDPSFDGFFGLWNEPNKENEHTGGVVNGAQPKVANTAAKVSKPSKFTGFFNPKPTPDLSKEHQTLPLLAPSNDSSNEDKAGFQRILELLDQQQPHSGRATTPPRAQESREVPASPPVQSPRGGAHNDLQNLLGVGSPQGNSIPQTRDSEFLLRLMQQPQHTRPDLNQANIGRRATQDTTPGLLPFSNLMISRHETPQQTPSTNPPPGFFNDSMRDEMQARDKLNPNAGAERRIPPGFYDPQRQPPAGASQPSGLQSGLQRPPGLEQMPPGYGQQIQPPRQSMVPPPGFQIPSRGQNAFPPGLVSNNPGDRVQYGMPSSGRAMPPPGFMGMNAPPPGFQLPPFGSDGLPFGPFPDPGGFGQGGQGFLPGQQRR